MPCDQIIFKSNKQEFEGYGGVRNNELGIITKLGEVDENGCGEFEVRIREGKNGHRLVTIKTGEDILPVSFKHGYALTGHAVQGADVDKFFYSVDKHSGYEAFNVGSSRHRDDCSIYLDKETLENVVYKTKDLDVIAAKEEFKACAYKYEKIGEKWEQVDVPLWKVGLKLLISKRTDLNFATDYSGQLKDNRKKDAYQEIIAGNQGRLNKLYDDLNHWKKDKETPLIENNQQIASDSKESEQLAKELKNFSSLEICLQKDFIINKGELIIDSMAIAKAVDNYKFLKEKNGSKFKSTKDLTDKINKQLASLKHGSYKDSDKEKIKWMDLGEIDKNLIIRSHLSKKDLSFLAKKEKQIKRYEERITAYANKIAVIHENLAKQTDKSNKLLTGNLGAMRDYLDAREKVLAAQEKITELDLYLKKPAIEKQLSIEALASFGVKITKFNLTSGDVIRAENALKAKRFKDQDLANDKQLLGAVILQKSESAILKGKYQEIRKVSEELKTAREERKTKAQIVVDHYHGFVDGDQKRPHEHEVVMSKLISQLQINYETVRKHAGLEEVKHYFASIDKNGTIITNPHFSKIMDVVELANQENSVIDSEKVAIVMEAQGEVLRICADHKKELADKGLLQTKLSTKHAEELEQLKKMAKFKNEELPNFLGKIYKDEGRKVLTRFEQLIAETNRPLLLAKAIGESPEMLGDLKSMSLWASITKGSEVKGIRANLENLGANLIKYINEDAMRAELQENLDSSKLVHQIKALDLEIANLKALLPNKEEQKLLDDIEHLKDSGKSELKGGGEEIKTLFKGDNAHDLLLDSIALKGEESFNNNNINVNNQKLDEKQLPRLDDKVKAASKSRGMRQSEAWNSDPKLDFKNVKASLTSSHIENIFRDYAAKLNPDGKIIKRGSSISCGSLNMNLKNGLWHRFSDGSKGDVFSLIEQATGSQKRDALLIVANIVGINAETKNNNKLRNQIDTNHDNQDSKQTPIVRNNVEAYKIIPSTAPRLNIDTHLSWLAKTNKIDNIWTYRNQKGELIGGTIRVVDKATGKKQVMPVSYCHNSKDASDQWKLKGFTDNGYKPIYGIEKLANENKPILIVEGEKTADHAQTLLPEYSVISWMGGAQGTVKVNWRQLGGREVTIWPDNDVAGEGAGRSILQELNIVNGFRGLTSLVDTKSLNLPEKWDLADKMPEHLCLGGIKEAIISCQNKGKNITTYIEEASHYNNENGQKVFWQQASIGIKNSSQEIKRKSSLHEEIHERLASNEVVSYMDYAKASGRDEPLHQFLSFKDGLYQEMLTSSMVNHLEIMAGSGVATKLKNLFGRDEDGNFLATPKEIVEQVQNIYSNSNSSNGAKYQINNEKYTSDNKKLAASNIDKAKLHEVLMKDFCILHQDQLGVKDLINVHKDKISDDLYKIISNYDLNNKDGQGGLKDSDQTKIAELAHNKINNTKWWQDLVEDQIKLAKTSKIEIITETDKRLELVEEHITMAMAASSIDNETVLARATSHYLEYIMANIDNMNNKELINKLVERAVYEEANIASRKENMRVFLIEDKKYGEFKKASGKLWQELMGAKLVKSEWQIQEKSPDLTNNEVRAIAKELVYNNYEQEVAQVIKEEPAVSVLHKQNPIAGKYLAEGLVDFRNNYGEELLTEARTKVMEEVAITQAELHDKIDNKMQGLDNKILDGKHKSLSGDILDGTVLAGDRDMTAKSVTTHAGEDLTHDMLLRGNAHYEQLHDHPEYHNHNTKIDHDSHNGLEHEYQHEITTRIQQTRTMQHEYHDRMEQEHERQININNDININY